MQIVYFLKHIVFSFIIVSLLAHAPIVHAQTQYGSTAALKAHIEVLFEQVQKLQKQLALLQAKKKPKETVGFSYKTKFYTGEYESLYHVDGGKLIPQTNTPVRKGDQLLWNTFINIAGSSFSDTYISEFRIYNDTNSEVSAFVEEKPDDTWILGFNREGESIQNIYNDESIINLLLHEHAHIVFFNTNGVENDFKKAFWNSRSQKYNEKSFVTVYASTNAVEDMVESFVHFVKYDKPTEKGLKYDKIRFFYEYPKLVKLRQDLRKGNLF